MEMAVIAYHIGSMMFLAGTVAGLSIARGYRWAKERGTRPRFERVCVPSTSSDRANRYDGHADSHLLPMSFEFGFMLGFFCGVSVFGMLMRASAPRGYQPVPPKGTPRPPVPPPPPRIIREGDRPNR